MSWTSVFPVLTDDMVAQFERDASAAEKRQLDAWFCIARTINAKQLTRHLVCTSLFWKNPRQDDPELPDLNRNMLRHAKRRGLVRRFDPWSHYVEPLLVGANHILKKRPDVVFRVYLASDLEFLVADLVRAGCEVRLMRSPSIRHNPGAMWRFLALEEKNALVTICDADAAATVGPDVCRTEEMAKAGLSIWRVPVWGDLAKDGTVPYRPMFGGKFGARLKLPMRQLMKAFVWHNHRGSITGMCNLPGTGERQISGAMWPDYGFDEFFLIAAVYPRAAKKGVLSFVPTNARSQLLPLDIEYVTWANRRSELVYFPAGRAARSTIESASSEALQGLMELEDFTLLPTFALTQRHPLPPMARRLQPAQAHISGHVWAWFNPSSAFWREKRWLAYRTECSPKWYWSRVNIAKLDAEGSIVAGSNKLLKLPTDFGVWGAEDPRLLVVNDALLLSYSDGWRMGLAELNEAGDVVKARIFRERQLIEGIALEKDPREKNWGFFATPQGLFVSYWVAPHVVFRCDERRARLGERWQTPWSLPAGVSQFHGGSSPVLHDDLFWRVVHSHSNSSRRVYVLWLMAFSCKPPFEVRWLCHKPIVVAQREKVPVPEQVTHDVVFCGSAERIGDGWLLFFGENDRRMRYGVIRDSLIEPHLKAVAG